MDFSDVLLTLKGENKASPSLSLLFELALENSKQLHLEWRGEGRGVDCFVL